MHRLVLGGWALTVAWSASVALRLALLLRRGALPVTPLESAASPTEPHSDRAFEDLLAEVAGVVDLIDTEPPAAAAAQRGLPVVDAQ